MQDFATVSDAKGSSPWKIGWSGPRFRNQMEIHFISANAIISGMACGN